MSIDVKTPIELYLCLFLVILIIVFIIVIEPRLSRKKLDNKNEHGSSKFADLKEIKNIFEKEDLNNIVEGGFPIWYERRNEKFSYVYVDKKSPHHLLVGSTGSGKSVTIVIPECMMFATARKKRSVIVTDPKGEIFKSTSKVFKDNGYDVITIDFRNPRQSNKINIMQPIIDEWKLHCKKEVETIIFITYLFKKNKINVEKYVNDEIYRKEINDNLKLDSFIIDIVKENFDEIDNYLKEDGFIGKSSIKEMYKSDDIRNEIDSYTSKELVKLISKNMNSSSIHEAEANRLTISLADLIFAEKQSNDPFWITSSKNLFIGIVGIFLEDYKKHKINENQINISSVKKFQNSSLIKENQNYLQRNINERKYGCLSKDYLTSILSASENTYKSVTAVFGSKTNIFDDLNVENITSVSEFQFSNIGKKPTALFIIVPDEDREYFQLVTIIVGILYKDLVKFANLPQNNGKLPVKVEWILDEFANCPPLDSIESLVSVARSRGMQFQFFIQSFSQLDQVYGKEISSIIQDNCALTYLKTNTYETAEVISKKLGSATIETSSISQSTDIFKIGANQTKSLLGRELLTANEIINLKYKTIIFPTVSNPVFRDTYLYNDIFPKYGNVDYVRRKESVLKRVTSNYYTVEDMRKTEENNFNAMMETEIKNVENEFNKSFYINENDKILMLCRKIKSKVSFKHRVIRETQDDNIGTIQVDRILNLLEQQEILKEIKPYIYVEFINNIKLNQTIIRISNYEKKRKYQ